MGSVFLSVPGRQQRSIHLDPSPFRRAAGPREPVGVDGSCNVGPVPWWGVRLWPVSACSGKVQAPENTPWQLPTFGLCSLIHFPWLCRVRLGLPPPPPQDAVPFTALLLSSVSSQARAVGSVEKHFLGLLAPLPVSRPPPGLRKFESVQGLHGDLVELLFSSHFLSGARGEVEALNAMTRPIRKWLSEAKFMCTFWV